MTFGFLLQRLSQCLVLIGLPAGGLLVALTAGTSSGAVAAVFPPWWTAMRTVTAASAAGSVLKLGVADFVVIMAPGDSTARARLRQAGAWLLLNPYGLAGCGPRSGISANGP